MPKTTPPAADPLEQIRARCRRPRQGCHVGKLLDALDEDAAELINRALACALDPEDDMTWSGIAGWVEDTHRKRLDGQTFARHARGNCTCQPVSNAEK